MASAPTAMPLLRERRLKETLAELVKILEAQRSDVLARYEDGASTLLAAAWDARLAEVIRESNGLTAAEAADRVATTLDSPDHNYDPAYMDAFLQRNSDVSAGGINDLTRSMLSQSVASGTKDPVSAVFATVLGSGAQRMASTMVNRSVNFGAHDAGAFVGSHTKVWVTGSNPRSRHSRMSGNTVRTGSRFSNGARYPGDPILGPADNANCNCSMILHL